MKLDFTKIGNLLCPTVGSEQGELVEDVQKCTVSSGGENDATVMTLTVLVKAPGESPAQVDTNGRQTWRCVEQCSFPHPEEPNGCEHVGSKPRLCTKNRGTSVKWVEVK